MKKIKLNKETLRGLDDRSLRRAFGGKEPRDPKDTAYTGWWCTRVECTFSCYLSDCVGSCDTCQ